MIPQRPTDPVDGDGSSSTPETVEWTEDVPVLAGEGHMSWYRDRVLLLAVGIVLAVDQLTKYIVVKNLRLHESWPEDGFFRFTYGTNSGTAFGLFPNQTFFLIIFSAGAIGFIYYFYRSHAMPSLLLRMAMGLQLGGALGNLLDRVRAGKVVDFLDVGQWPIFNIADSAIVTGITLLIVITFFTRDEKSKQEDGAGEPVPK
jgi:signal peptidase II